MNMSSRVRRGLVPLVGALALGVFLPLVLFGCASAPPGVVVVRSNGLMFEPATITVTPGTTVRWINENDTAITSTSMDLVSLMPTGTVNKPTSWNSNPLNPGGQFDHKFTTPGVFPYQDMVHNYMEGTVTVQAK